MLGHWSQGHTSTLLLLAVAGCGISHCTSWSLRQQHQGILGCQHSQHHDTSALWMKYHIVNWVTSVFIASLSKCNVWYFLVRLLLFRSCYCNINLLYGVETVGGGWCWWWLFCCMKYLTKFSHDHTENFCMQSHCTTGALCALNSGPLAAFWPLCCDIHLYNNSDWSLVNILQGSAPIWPLCIRMLCRAALPLRCIMLKWAVWCSWGLLGTTNGSGKVSHLLLWSGMGPFLLERIPGRIGEVKSNAEEIVMGGVT